MKNQITPRPFLSPKAFWVLTAMLALIGVDYQSRAASATWLAAPFNNNWIAAATTNNWSTGVGTFPGSLTGTSSSDIATFNNASSITTINNASGFAIGGITFDTASAAAYTINTSGGTWRVVGAGIKETATVVNRQTINGALRMASSGTLVVDNDSTTSTATLNINNGISVNNSGSAGTLYLEGANTGLNVLGGFTEQAFSTAPGTLIKTNAGTWVLTGAATHHNPTLIVGGMLVLMGTANIPNSPQISVNAATLSISNALTSANYLLVTNSGTLIMTNMFFRTPLTIGQLTASNATVDISVNGASAYTNIVVTSFLDAGPNIAFNVQRIVNLPVATTVDLIGYTGTDPLASDFSVSVPAGYTAGPVAVDTVNKLVTVTITPPAAASSLVWSGVTNSILVSNWDTTTKDWLDAATRTFPQSYADPDTVLFDDTAGNNTVTLAATFSPFTTTVTNNVLNYTFNGPGALSGSYGLSKQGSATLTLAEAGGDNFSGGIIVGGGTLVLDDTNSVITGGITNNSGTTVQIGRNDGGGNLPGGLVDVEGSLIFSRANNLSVSTPVTGGGSLTQNGNGTLTLTSSNSYFGVTTVSRGTLALAGAGKISASAGVLVSNATFSMAGISGTTVLTDFSVTNAGITLGPTNLNLPLSVNTFEADGIVSKSNIINLAALPPTGGFPYTIPLIQSANPISLAGNNFNFALGTLPAGSPAYTGTLAESADGTTILLTVTAGPTGQRPTVTWADTNDVNLTTNWSSAVNWQLPGAPGSADNVIFDSTTTVGAIGTIDNIVDANFTVASLSYLNTNGLYHVTQIPAGNVLTVSGNFTVGNFTEDGAVSHVAFVDAGTLVVNATNSNLVGNSGVSGSSGNASLDLSGLSNFVYSASSSTLGVGNVGGRGLGTLLLAGASNNITAGTVAIETSSASSSVNATVTLGAGTNIINASTFNLGATRSGATLQFPAGSTTGGLRMRGTGGTDSDRMTLTAGNRSSGGSSGTANGQLLFNGHQVDLKFGTLTLGECDQVSPVTGSGTLQFDTGIVDATTILMAINTTNGTANGTGTVGAGGTLIVGSGGFSMVNNQPSGNASGTLNINAGTVICSNGISKTTVAGTATINLTDGKLNLVSGTIGTLALPIDNFNLSDNGTTDTLIQLNVTVGVTNIVANNFSAANITAITITSVAGLVGQTQIPLIKYGGGDPFNNLVLNPIPGYPGAILVDNTGNGSVDLSIAPPPPLIWVGAVGSTLNSTWNTVTMNWLNGVTPADYSDGTFVQFDDTARNGVVTLAATVSPAGLDVTNNNLNYTFNGTGGISGSTTLAKQGTGTLVLDNSGTNNFTGGVQILGGSLQIGKNDTNGTLPAGSLIDNGTLALSRMDNLTFSNVINGTGGLSQINTNTVSLAGLDSYSGATYIGSGTLRVNNTNALGSWSGAAVTVTNGGTLDLGGLSMAIPQANPAFGAKAFYIAGTGVGGQGAIVNNGPNAQLSAFQSITLTANSTIGGVSRWDIRNGSPLLDLAGFTLTKTGTNQDSFVAVSVTSGNIVINQGILSFEVNSAVNGTGTITVNNGGSLGHFRLASQALTMPITLNGGSIINLGTTGAGSINDAPITLTANSGLIGSTSTNSVTLNGVISQSGGSYGLTKTGVGSFILTADSTYSGNTIISAGSLALNGSISNSAAISINTNASLDVSGRGDTTLTLNSGQTLSGFGTVTGTVLSATGSVVAPGSTSVTGNLTVTANVNLNGTTSMKLNAASATNDVLTGSGFINYGGTLQLTNISGSLNGSSAFKLFNAAPGNYVGFFSSIVPAIPAPGLAWNTNTLTTDGTIRFTVTVNPNPTNITAVVSGSALTLSWPADHTGWTLQVQTNTIGSGLGTNWVDVPGSSSVNSELFTIDPSKGTVFYRMKL